MSLIMSISGVRGIYGESLTNEIAANLALAFASYLRAEKCKREEGSAQIKVILARDSRISGPQLKIIVQEQLLKMGCIVIDLDIVPTPTAQRAVTHHQADGALVITASHNPLEWNGLKFIGSRGIFLTAQEAETLLETYRRQMFAPFLPNGTLVPEPQYLKQHVSDILKFVDVDRIRQRNFKIVLDPVNGAGCIGAQALLSQLGAKVTVINGQPTGKFGRKPEPIPENLLEIGEMIRTKQADIGFALDPDADRLAIINEKGEPIGEDYTLVLVSRYILSQSAKGLTSQYSNVYTKSAIVTNLSTTMAVMDIAKEFAAEVVWTKIGEVNVSEAILHHKAIIGGEGNGGVIPPFIGLGRDSLAGIALILDYLSTSKNLVSDLVSEVPKYYMVKAKQDCADPREVNKELIKLRSIIVRKEYDLLPASVRDAVGNFISINKLELNEMDGIKFTFNNSWLHVRPSNTEPIIRFISEATTLAEAEQLIGWFKQN